jgi:CRP/FNR family cyclic AMP-dependent transcriptional regulator
MRTILSFCQGFVEKTFDRGDVLLVEGEKEGILYILIEGSLEVLKGDLQINVVSEPGALFGEISVLLDIPHSATVKALSPSRLYVVERANEFLQSHTDIAYQVAKLLAQRLYGITSYLIDMKTQFEDQKNHLGMVDEVLETLLHQQAEESTPGSDRDPDKTI